MFPHIVGSFQIIIRFANVVGEKPIRQLTITVETDREVPLNNEVDLSHVVLLLVEVALLRRILELARHEAERDLIQKVAIVFLARAEETLECAHREDILKQELTHNVLLDAERDLIKEVFPLLQNSGAIVIPKVSEVRLNLIS